MSITSDSSVPVPELDFTATVDRVLLHRRHPQEAFLADAAQTGPHRFVAAALLPAAHPHYAAHTGPSRHRDPLLLLECARQAETHAAHTLYGVEPDAHFVLRNWSAEFAAASEPASEPVEPTELLLTAVTSNPRLVRDRVRGLEFELELWAAGSWAGRVRMEVGYLSAAAYRVLRARRHGGPPPSSDDLVPADGRPVDPARVGRLRATDVVLLDVAAGQRVVTAVLRVPTENPSLFDHAQDHVPAMVLVEAARQLATLATQHWGGPGPDHTYLASLSSSFSAYAELTGPVELVATPAGGRAVEVIFRQDGADLGQARLGLAVPARTAERARGRGATWLGPR